MENASKALIMVGGVLIGILVLSLAVYLFRQGGGAASSVADEIKSQQIAQFNRQFDKYTSADNMVTIYDVVTVGGLARNYNIENDLDKVKDKDRGYVKVILHNFTKKHDGSIDYETSGYNEDKRLELSDRVNDKDDEFRRITEALFEKDRAIIDKTLGEGRRNPTDASKVGYLRIYECVKVEYNGPDGRISDIEFKLKEGTSYYNE